jgi:hypothetical protein
MDRSSSPLRRATHDLLLCLLICGFIVAIDHNALRNPVRLAIMMFVTIAVPVGNYFMYRRHDRVAR